MNRAQTIKFWKEIGNTTFVTEPVSKFSKIKGYPSKRTLARYVQANTAFEGINNINDDQAFDEITTKIGWNVKFLKKLYVWWAFEFKKTSQSISELPNQTFYISSSTEIQHHWDNLESFGKKFRDNILFPDFIKASKLNLNIDGITQDHLANKNPLEILYWGTDFSTITNNPLFPYLKKHLVWNACWDKLNELAMKYFIFLNAAIKARKAIYGIFDNAFPTQIPSSTKEILSDSILTDIDQQASGTSGIDFNYNITQEKVGWSLQLGAWHINTCGERLILELIIETHKALHQTLFYIDEIRALINVDKELKLKEIEFRQSLLPDDLLRKFIRNSHCELCSWTLVW